MKNMEIQKLADGRIARMQSFPETADQFCSDGIFEVDDQNRSIVENLCKYVDNNITGNLDIRKGLLLMGTMGTGKTIMMQTLAKLTLKEKFRMVSLVNVAEHHKERGPVKTKSKKKPKKK